MSQTAEQTRRRPGREAAPREEGKPQLSEGKRAERKLGWLLCAPAAIMMLAVTALPDPLLGLAVAAALRPAGSRTTQEFIGLDNYVTVLTNPILVDRVRRHHADHRGHRWRSSWCSACCWRSSCTARSSAAGWCAPSALIPYGIVTVVAAFSWRFAWTPDTGYLANLFGDGGAAHRALAVAAGSSSWPRSGRPRRSWRCC